MDDHRKLVGELIRGGQPNPSASELNGLLHWLAGRSNESARAIQSAFNAEGISEDIARRHVLAYLDQTLFRHHDDYYRLFGLTPDCSFDQIRRRHKQLLQIFHPDRHTEDSVWFTKKAEVINLAYAYFRANHGKRRSGTSSDRAYAKPPPPRYARPAARAPRPGLWRSIAAKKGRIRRALKAYIGSPRLFVRRLYIVLYAVPVVLVIVVYLNNTAGPAKRPGLAVAEESSGESLPPEAMTQIRIQADRPKITASTMGGADTGGAPLSAASLRIEGSPSPDESGDLARLLDHGKAVGASQSELSTSDAPQSRISSLAGTSAHGTDPVPVVPRNIDRAAIDDEIAVREVLTQYEFAYNNSNPRRLSQLFHEDAAKTRSRAAPNTSDTELTAFGATDRTKIIITNPQVRKIDDHHINVTAEYSVDRTTRDGDRSSENGRLEMRLVMVDGKPRIRHLQHVANDDSKTSIRRRTHP